MNLLEQLLRHELLEAMPPVLLDIGASTHLPPEWSRIARYSVGVAFDPDCRQTGYLESSGKGFRKLYTVPAIVHPAIDGECDFYLTSSPECSSTLVPDQKALAPFYFAPFFEVEKKVRLPSVTLKKALADLHLERIDWYKSDTQGTDLRLFAGLPDNVRNHILAAEFEPGLMDAYVGEDKLPDLLKFMDTPDWYLAYLHTHGSQYTGGRNFTKLQNRLIPSVLPANPGWAETGYLNTMQSPDFSQRDFFVGYLFAECMREHVFAAQIAAAGAERFPDDLFETMSACALKQIPWAAGTWRKILRKLFAFH